jgi:membrane-associated phospholipid phosphatase
MNAKKNLLILVIISFQAQAQPDSTKRFQSAKFYVNKLSLTVPVLLGGFGALSTTDNDFIYKQDLYEARNKLIPSFRTHVDDYLQYAPIAGVIVLNVAGIKGKHDRINQAALLIKSELIMTAIVFPFKQLTAVPRPDDNMRTSFPSGHTAQAFVAATFLHKEYGKEYPLLSVLGYSTAAGIGLLRVMNNRHWISDVLVGAAVGIFSTNLAYLTHQNKWGKKHKLFSGATIVPSYTQGSFGICMIVPVY